MADCSCAALSITSDGTLAGTVVTKADGSVLEGDEKAVALVALAADILAEPPACSGSCGGE